MTKVQSDPNTTKLVANEQMAPMTKEGSEIIGKPVNITVVGIVQRYTNVATRLKEAVHARPASNRSADLVPLSHEFDIMRKQLRSLISATKNYSTAVKDLETARGHVVEITTKLGSMSPLKDVIESSIASINKESAISDHQFVCEYDEKVIGYATEWEHILSTRVDAEIRECNELHKRLQHYQSKVTKLREQFNEKEKEGKDPGTSTDKLNRNEEKLKKAWSAHEEYASKTCVLIEESTMYGWKDLCPLLIALMELDNHRAETQHKILAKLPSAVKDLKKVQDDNWMNLKSAPMMTPSTVTGAVSDSSGEYDSEDDGEGNPYMPDRQTATKPDSSKGVMGFFGK